MVEVVLSMVEGVLSIVEVVLSMVAELKSFAIRGFGFPIARIHKWLGGISIPRGEF